MAKPASSNGLPMYTAVPLGEGEQHGRPARQRSPTGGRKQGSVPTKLIVRSLIAFAALIVFGFLFAGPQPTIVKEAVEQWRSCEGGQRTGAEFVPSQIHQDLAATTRKKSKDERPSKIIKLTFTYGKGSIDPTGQSNGMNDVRDRLVEGHIEHARIHGYRQYVQRVDLMNNIITKPATALQIILEELQKPEEQRAEWIVQHDADMVVYNYQFPLETFLPPPERSDIHLMGTRDGNGFNSGCLYMRVSPLMAQILGGNLMYDVMPGNRPWNYAEQGMMANMIADIARFNATSVIMPKHWVNAYPPKWEGEFKAGDWIMHTVAWSKAQLPDYVNEAALRKPENQISPQESGIDIEVQDFWRKIGEEKAKQGRKAQHRKL